MSTEENKQVIRRWVEEWNRGNLEGVYALFAPDFDGHSQQAGLPPGLEGLKQGLRLYHDALPDSQMTIELLIAEEDKVAGYGFLAGTHKGSLFGIPPKGKKVRVPFLVIHRFKDGRITEGWHIEDILAALQQIDAIPAPQSAQA